MCEGRTPTPGNRLVAATPWHQRNAGPSAAVEGIERMRHRFRGTRGATNSAALVVVEDAATGELVGPLRHLVRYSPTGFNWGYDGAGPRELARSLLAAVLDENAVCPACSGAEVASCDVCRDGLRPTYQTSSSPEPLSPGSAQAGYLLRKNFSRGATNWPVRTK